MTNEKIIKKLEHYRYCLKFQFGWYGKDDDEALDMAIKALEQEPCEDCISRQSALDALEEPLVWTGSEYELGLQSQWKLDVDAIKSLSSVTPQPKWIPVSERLPKANGRYLVTRGLNTYGSLWNRVYIINYSDLMGLKKERIWWDGNVGKSDFKRIDDVVAWKLLPEPYKAESEE